MGIFLNSCWILNKTRNTFIAIGTCWFEHKNIYIFKYIYIQIQIYIYIFKFKYIYIQYIYIQNSQELGSKGEGEGEGERVSLLTFRIDCLPQWEKLWCVIINSIWEMAPKVWKWQQFQVHIPDQTHDQQFRHIMSQCYRVQQWQI